MLRISLVTLAVLLLAVPAGAAIYETNGANPDVSITLTIGCYTNIYWNNTTTDHEIAFNDVVQDGANGGDWFRATGDGLTGLYFTDPTDPKASQDPWAEGYYESYDEAFFWIQANCNVQMTVTTGGNLKNAADDELDSWFTMALTNNTGSADGFIMGGARISNGTIPLDGPGVYADDDNPQDGTMEIDGASAHHPIQYSFPMGVGAQVYLANFSPFAEGTILFHARVLRSGISDPSGVYTSTIDMAFTEL